MARAHHMARAAAIFAASIAALPAGADTVVAVRTLRAQTVLTAADVMLSTATVPGAATAIEQVVGQEARSALYAGRPVRVQDVGPPAVVDRNQIITLVYVSSGLEIIAEGRSLSRAGIGDQVRVMNMSSRTTISGTVQENGTVRVSN